MSTVYIVGKGPSLLRVRPENFADPTAKVIALNHAIWNVRQLHLPNPLFGMAKDGCVRHGPSADYTPPGPDHDCGGDIIPLEAPETLIVTTAESPNCVWGYEPRITVDVQAEFGIPWWSTSTELATKLALKWGADRIVYVSHDGYATGDLTRVDQDVHVEEPEQSYRDSAIRAEAMAKAGGAAVEWLTP